jgi:hypothetical protein
MDRADGQHAQQPGAHVYERIRGRKRVQSSLILLQDIQGGKCGSITVLYKGYTVDAADPKEEEKIKLWSNPELVVNKIIEVKCVRTTINITIGELDEGEIERYTNAL